MSTFQSGKLTFDCIEKNYNKKTNIVVCTLQYNYNNVAGRMEDTAKYGAEVIDGRIAKDKCSVSYRGYSLSFIVDFPSLVRTGM